MKNYGVKIFGLMVFIFILNQNYFGKNIGLKDFSDIVEKKDSAKSKDETKTIDTRERTYTLEMDFGTNKTYKGRTNSTKEPYYTTSFNYEAKSGFFIYLAGTNYFAQKGDTSAESVQARKYSVDQFLFNIGYDFKIGKKTDASVSFTRYFNADTALLNSGIISTTEFYMDHDFNFINEKLIFDFDHASPNDFSVALESYHPFYIDPLFLSNDELAITPKFTITLGTQNFITKKKKNAPITRRNTVVENRFTLIALDFTLPITYSIGNFSIEPAFNYTVPMNQPAYLNEKPTGYGTLSLTYDF